MIIIIIIISNNPSLIIFQIINICFPSDWEIILIYFNPLPPVRQTNSPALPLSPVHKWTKFITSSTRSLVQLFTYSANKPWNKSLNFRFPTKHVIPKSLKVDHWPWKLIIIAYLIKSWDNSWETVMKFAKLPKILWIHCLHLIRFRPKSGNRTVFGTSFRKRPMVIRLFSWLQQEDTVVGSSPQKTCSINTSIKKQMYFIGNSSKWAHLVPNYSSCKVLQSHLGPAWSKKTLCSINTMRRRSFRRNVFPKKLSGQQEKPFMTSRPD